MLKGTCIPYQNVTNNFPNVASDGLLERKWCWNLKMSILEFYYTSKTKKFVAKGPSGVKVKIFTLLTFKRRKFIFTTGERFISFSLFRQLKQLLPTGFYLFFLLSFFFSFELVCFLLSAIREPDSVQLEYMVNKNESKF